MDRCCNVGGFPVKVGSFEAFEETFALNIPELCRGNKTMLLD